MVVCSLVALATAAGAQLARPAGGARESLPAILFSLGPCAAR
jgi:hypothetical protein